MSRVKEIADMIRREIPRDRNSPYTVEFKTGKEDRHGVAEWKKKQVEALSQPSGDRDRERLQEGDRYKTSRFWAMVDNNKVDVGNRIFYKKVPYEIKVIQDWDETIRAVGVRVD